MHDLDAVAVRRWADACVRSLDANREAIDQINVFPVPDGDTGTNLLHTMQSALDALLRTQITTVGEALTALAKGALQGARGNSGVILSQVLRGLAEATRDISEVTGAALRQALHRADELATAAVSNPMAGTVLSVLHAAAEAAKETPTDELDDVVTAAAKAGAVALAETPRQLAVLAKAGVVDAGGRGLLVLLDTLAAIVTGQELPAPKPNVVPRTLESLTTDREAGSTEFEYEVMYLLDQATNTDLLKIDLNQLGDCVSVVGDGTDLWTVHVHCNDIGAAIEAGVRTGRPHRITVQRFADQIAAQATRFVRDRAIVVLASGGVDLFRAEGASVVDLAKSVTANDLLSTIAGTRARHVAILPGDPDVRDQLDEAIAYAVAAGQDVVVVPTFSPVQALAALAVHDVSRRAGDDVVAMAEAAAATRRGELAISDSEAITWVGTCQPGDLLGMLDDEVVLIEPGPPTQDNIVDLACRLVDRMLGGGGELVTLILGEACPGTLVETLEDHVRVTHPEVEVTAYPGGQPDAVIFVGVE